MGATRGIAEFFPDGRAGTDRWGRGRAGLRACGTSWDDVCSAYADESCVAVGSLVLTERGYIPIETVAIGDAVLTHRGRWQAVTGVHLCDGPREVVNVRAQGVPTLRVTPDHELLVRRGPAHDPAFAAAAYRAGQSRARTRQQAAGAPEWRPATTVHGDYASHPSVPGNSSEHDELFWWLVGRWLGDGSQNARIRHTSSGAVRPNRQVTLTLTCGHHDLAELLDRIGPYAGYQYDHGHAVQIRLRDRCGALRDVIAGCGRGASGKRIPRRLLDLDTLRSTALLAGYLSADGHTDRRTGARVAESTSRALLLGLALVAEKATGVVSSIRPSRVARAHVIKGHACVCLPTWTMSLSPRNNSAWRDATGLTWKLVRTVDADAIPTRVVDLSVEGDASFIVEGALVHNCPGDGNPGTRVDALRTSVCNVQCATCPGSPARESASRCGWARGQPLWGEAVDDLGGSLRLDHRTTGPPDQRVPEWPAAYAPILDAYAKPWADRFRDLPMIATTAATALPSKRMASARTIRGRLGHFRGRLAVGGWVKAGKLDEAWDDLGRGIDFAQLSDVDIMVVHAVPIRPGEHSCMHLLAANRQFAHYQLLIDAGFPLVVMDIPAYHRPWLHDEYLDFCDRSCVAAVSIQLHSFGKRGSLNPLHVRGLRIIHERLASDVAVMIVGASTITGMTTTAHILKGRNLVFVGKEPWAAIYYRLISSGAIVPGMPRAEVFARNLKWSQQIAEKALG